MFWNCWNGCANVGFDPRMLCLFALCRKEDNRNQFVLDTLPAECSAVLGTGWQSQCRYGCGPATRIRMGKHVSLEITRASARVKSTRSGKMCWKRTCKPLFLSHPGFRKIEETSPASSTSVVQTQKFKTTQRQLKHLGINIAFQSIASDVLFALLLSSVENSRRLWFFAFAAVIVEVVLALVLQLPQWWLFCLHWTFFWVCMRDCQTCLSIARCLGPCAVVSP